MRYTVVVKRIISSNGDFERQRYNNVSKKIVKFLMKYNYSFSIGIYNFVVNCKTSQNYIEVYKKGDDYLDELLETVLRRLEK